MKLGIFKKNLPILVSACKTSCMHHTFKKLFLSGLLALTVAGCSHIPLPHITIPPTKAETELIEANKLHEAKNAELQAKNDAFTQQIAGMEASFKVKYDSNLSLGTANVMAGYDTLIADPNKNKYTLAAIPALEVATAALPTPTVKDYQSALSTQRKLLSDQATELAKGKEEIANAKTQATETKAALDKITADKAQVEKEKTALAAAKLAEAENFGKETTRLAGQITTESKAAAELRAEQDAAKLKKAEERKDLEKLVVTILMIIGVVAGIIAYVFKSPLQLFNPTAAIASAAAIGLAIAISFLPLGWLIGGVCAIIAMVVAAVIIELRKEKATSSGLAGATAEYLEKNPLSDLGQHIEEWVGKGTKTAKLIEDKIKDLNVK